VDKLEELFSTQQKLQERLGFNLDHMHLEDRTAYVKEYTLHTMHEMHEMLQELPFFKDWKRYPENPFKQVEMVKLAKKEWIDALHFFLNVSIALGFNADTLYAAYMEKNKINHERQLNAEEYKPCIGGHL
jgi:dimeric dUTPase (all-alpha-NTP-PPase superfamily)